MEKKFVKCKVERCEHKKGGPAVKVNDLFPKRLFTLDGMEEIFIIHEEDSDEFKVCQLTIDEEGYNIIYNVKTRIVKEIDKSMEIAGIDKVNNELYFYVKRFIKHTIFYENVKMKK